MNKQTAEELLIENGYEGVVYLTNLGYDSALIGVTHDDRAVYDYELMLQWCMREEGMTEEEAADWISYNTIRALSYMGESAPLIMYPLIGAERDA